MRGRTCSEDDVTGSAARGCCAGRRLELGVVLAASTGTEGGGIASPPPIVPMSRCTPILEGEYRSVPAELKLASCNRHAASNGLTRGADG